MVYSLQWRSNGRNGLSNHQPPGCLLNRLFRRRSKKTPKLGVTGLCAGNSPVTGEFPAQRANNAENVSIWWRHHVSGDKYSIMQSLLSQSDRSPDRKTWNVLSKKYCNLHYTNIISNHFTLYNGCLACKCSYTWLIKNPKTSIKWKLCFWRTLSICIVCLFNILRGNMLRVYIVVLKRRWQVLIRNSFSVYCHK